MRKTTIAVVAAAMGAAGVAGRAAAADAEFTLGVPGAAKIAATTDAAKNAWLKSNVAYPAMSIVSPYGGLGANRPTSSTTVAGAERVTLAANEAGFALERTKPEYYLGDRIDPPDGVDWSATYDKFVADGRTGLLFDPSGEAVYVTEGGTRQISWVLTTGKTNDMTYVTSVSCSGRPRRIYWTDEPYNAPAVDLSGKFVKFFGSPDILDPVYGVYRNSAAGVEQVISNRVVRGLVLDSATKMLYAYGELQGQVVMAYYDTGTYERMLHVQPVEICRPVVNVMKGDIGRALKPDGRGYDTSGLRAKPTVVSPTDNRGEYLYQHKGQYSYSPKSGNVYPLRPTTDCRWNAEIYWMETDEMEVQWPFELDQYECDWPADATVFVRGTIDGDTGRDVYIPSSYTPTLMDYQEPEGHAVAPTANGTFTTKGEGFSLLRLTADDNIWFVPIRSILRTNKDFFTLEPEEIAVGRELRLRGGSVAGTAGGFSPSCDADSPGYVYEAASARVWNPNLYKAPTVDSSSSGGVSTNAISSVSSGEGTNTYASVVYAVTANGDGALGATRPTSADGGLGANRPTSADGGLGANRPTIEVWWNTTIREEGMAEALTIPTLPQVYSVRWPYEGENPAIVIASQQGSGCRSFYAHNSALYINGDESYATLASRAYFGESGGTVMFWMRGEDEPQQNDNSAIISLAAKDAKLSVDWPSLDTIAVSYRGTKIASAKIEEPRSWHNVAVAVDGSATTLYIDGVAKATGVSASALFGDGVALSAGIGAANDFRARPGVNVGELLFWNEPLDEGDVTISMYTAHAGESGGFSLDGPETARLTGCYVFVQGTDLAVTGTERRTFTEKTLGIRYEAYDCLLEEVGPPALDAGVFDADSDTTPKVYVQNDPDAVGYNPNEEHAFVKAGDDGYVAWAIRGDLNTAESSEPGVLVEYVKDGAKKMRWFDVAVTNYIYKTLAAGCTAGKALPGPHPLDLLDDPWRPETYWEEATATSPAHRDRKGQLWAKAEGDLHVHMYYPMQSGFAFPSLETNLWPEVGTSIPWLSLLDPETSATNVLAAAPAPWLWRVEWPEEVAEIEIGRTLTTAASGLPEVWNAKSVGILWPATDAERDATAVLFDPTVAQSSGFPTSTYATVAAAVADLGIKQGAGGNGTLRKGRWTFDGLPPSISSRFYLDTTAPVGSCLKLIGEQEDNTGGVSLLHVNVLNDAERETLEALMDDTASDAGKAAWRTAVKALATKRVEPSPHRSLSDTEDAVDYIPRDHYALFTMGATNYVTLIENDSTNELMNVAAGDPINMHVVKVVPKYYTGRVVTREDPLNLLSQQLSVIYAEAFAGSPEDYVFEWRKCSPHKDGSVPKDFDGEYEQKFPVTAGLTRFVIGQQGDTLANMVNTYYAMRYRAASTNAPSYAAMGDAWSEWTDPPALAEGWVQRVLNNVTPFTQRMRDLVDNEAETAVTMIRQAGAPYEGDVALNQDNLTSVGLIQLYETILNKAESMSLQMGINNADANKQLQLAVARLADLYNVLGDEAYTDALNPTIGFGSNFDTVEKTGYELEYGAMSSALFCFDNQVPTLLDEELALLRGRTGENAPATTISPYYNRLVWNFTRGMNAGEVAYAVNYDISGNRKGVIDYSQAAEMYPQGHGDAYGHYLSALSGYYRLLRNPYFSWGEPAMGEMVVADSVVNVDYYDEAQFAKAAENVAKAALETVDRTARKAYRDNGGATGAGYIDGVASRNFGYGEWASRGGFGALCNWAVANSILGEEPKSGLYRRYSFTGDGSAIVSTDIPEDAAPELKKNGTWTVELQVVPGGEQPEYGANLLLLGDDTHAFGLTLGADGALTFASARMIPDSYTNTVHHFFYTNVASVAGAEYDFAVVCATNFSAGATNSIGFAKSGADVLECWFYGPGPAPAGFPDGYDPIAQLKDGDPVAPDWTDLGWIYTRAGEEDPSAYVYDDVEYTYEMEDDAEIRIGESRGLVLSPGGNYLVAVRSSGGDPVVSVFNAAGQLVAEDAVNIGDDASVTWAVVGSGFNGELGEVRVWEGVRRSNDELVAKREYVSSVSDGLSLYLRAISRTAGADVIKDEVAGDLQWYVIGGDWLEERESGMSIDFTDEGLKRIDRGTVSELSSLASIVPQIQKKVDQMDAGLNPLGLANGAIPFDLTPIGVDDGSATHFEQIRDRAKTALANANKALERAQESANRMRLVEDAALAQEEMLSSAELEFKNRLIEYFGYPYEGDIGPSGSYEQGYDGPDVYHYAWMDPAQYGLDKVDSTAAATIVTKTKPELVNVFVPFLPSSKTESEQTLTFELSATGFVLKPSNITGKRRAQGKIQDALADFIVAYASFKGKTETYKNRLNDFESAISSTAYVTTPIMEAKFIAEEAGAIAGYAEAGTKAALGTAINTLEAVKDLGDTAMDAALSGVPQIQGAGMTVNIDPRALAGAAMTTIKTSTTATYESSLLTAKNSLTVLEAGQKFTSLAKDMLTAVGDLALNRVEKWSELNNAWYELRSARSEVADAYRELQAKQAAVETVVAEAERVIDERTLKRQQSVDSLTKQRYNEMFFRIERNNALSRYSSMFDLAQKYVYLAAQAYDYETGLLSSDAASGDAFIAEVVGARALGAFDSDGEPLVTTGDGDGGLADILARLDQNWLALKPRLGINNPQPYATWFSLRTELFRIYDDEDGDKTWKTLLEKSLVEDLNSVAEFRRYCQPLSGSSANKEPGFVFEFPTQIVFGENFFGNETVGGDSPLDSTWYATHIAAAGVHFEGYDDKSLAKTPTCYLVPVGEDRMRSVGDPDTILSWKVVDQTIPAPYAIGSTQLDDPDWTPLYDGATGGNDLGARIRKHPSFRAYYDDEGKEPKDDELDCTRLIGRSAWNTRWLLIVPAGAMNADRDAAATAFASAVRDIKLGLKTYSASGN